METTHRTMNLSFSIEDKNGNNIRCLSESSPNSVRSSSSWSCETSDSPADVEMEDFICDATSDQKVKTKETVSSSTITCSDKEKSSSREISVKSSGTIVADLGSSKIENCNKNMTFLIVDPKNSASERGIAEVCDEASPDSGERELSEVNSSEQSQCGSSDNCCSVSSSEMVMRSNSFISHETDQPLGISLLGESRTSLDLSSDLGVVSGMLPDVCEGLREEHLDKVSHRESKNHNLECTYIQPSNQTFLIEDDLIQMPFDSQRQMDEKALLQDSEKHGCVTPVHQAKNDLQKLPCNTGESNHSTPVEGKTVLLTASEDLDISGNAQTSTPVQSVSNKTFCLPPLSESPLQKDEGDSLSPMAQVISQQKGDSSQKPKPLMAASKSNKVEIKRFPKPNFSNIKSKIMSRATNAFKTSSAQVPKTSSFVPQANENKSIDHSAQHKTSPAKSTSATPANVKGSIAAKRTRSSTYQEGGPASKSRPRRWSESATSSKTSKDGLQEKNPKVQGATPQTLSKGGSPNQGQKTKPVDGSSVEGTQRSESLKACGKNLKISLLAVSAKPATGAPACEWSRGRPGPQAPPARTGGASAARVPAVSLRPPLSAAAKLKLGTAGKDESNTSDTPSHRVQLRTPEAGVQSRPAQASSLTTSKLPIKPKTQPKISSTSQANGLSKQDHSETSVGSLSKPPSNRSTLLRSKLPPTRGVSSVSGCKNTPPSSQSSVRSSSSLLKTPTSARPVRPAVTPTIDKNKSRTASRNLQPPANGHPDLVPPESKTRSVEYYKVLCEKKNQTIQQLENMVRSNNRRFEAVAVVIKHLCTEQEEGMKRRVAEASQELISLREELVSSALSCERLEQEKEELRAAFDGVLQKVQEQHRLDLADLEERLKTFYSTEWEKVHQTYQEEADKCKALMEQQLEELRSKHEALKKELEDGHIEEVDNLKHHFDESFKELKQSHEKELESLTTTLKKSEETLTNQIQELIAENNELKEKLKAEEKRRKDLAERTQDSHTLYLEQELESLKVVLDIKNKQIHEQDKKLMQIDKLMERNVKLDECLKKLQQENEDLKARMDKHAALSRQLSTEQAFLQESLQKESKVNKRLSMENEELLWKLHNGDLSSPRKVSPSTSLTLQSPRNSGIFSSPPVSPR